MAFTNSKLATYKKLSPNHSGQRTQPITKIAIHHMAGDCTIETCGDIFAPTSRQASSNYGIGSDGRIGMYVEEKNRAWTTSSDWCDQRAVTIEVADCQSNPWKCSDKAMNALVELCADICKRNSIKKCTYTGTKDGTLQMHKWYANTDCPGAFLEGKFKWIAEQVNKKLGATETPVTTIKETQLYSEGYISDKTKTATKLKTGTKVTVTEDDGWGWSKITYNKKTYFVMNKYLSDETLSQFKKATTTEKITSRTEPNSGSKLYKVIPKGTAIKVICYLPNNWVRISVGGTTCYISNKGFKVK